MLEFKRMRQKNSLAKQEFSLGNNTKNLTSSVYAQKKQGQVTWEEHRDAPGIGTKMNLVLFHFLFSFLAFH